MYNNLDMNTKVVLKYTVKLDRDIKDLIKEDMKKNIMRNIETRYFEFIPFAHNDIVSLPF